MHTERHPLSPIRALIASVLAVASCSPARVGCEVDRESQALHDDVREASGVALSRERPDVLWTHNDSDGGAAIFAIDTGGKPIARVQLEGAHNRDWEDIAVARCPRGGPEGDCVFVADIGDNRASREGIGLWISAEPDPRHDRSARATFLRLHYPDGPRDAEALAILEDGSAVIVSKGREHPIAVYRSAPLAWPVDGEPIQLTLVQTLSEAPVDLPEQITGASARGDVVALRAYAGLQFYRIHSDRVEALLPEPFPLDSLAEPQGEGVTMAPGGRVYLISEAGPQAIAPRLTYLNCRLP